MRRISGRLHFASIVFQLAASFWWSGAHAQALVHFDLPAQSLAKSLKAIGAATKTDIGFNSNQVARFTAPELKADLTLDDALLRVLAGTGLRSQHLNDHTIVIAAAEPPTSNSVERGSSPAKAPSAVDSMADAPHAANLAGSSSPLVVAQTGMIGANDATNSENKTSQGSAAELDAVVVTGTHIHGQQVSASPITIIDQDAINVSGITTLEDLARSLPQAFGGGPQQDSLMANQGAESENNVSAASGINLHGLGARATLVLLNGERLPPSDRTSITDVSLIPLSIIDHIEVLTDGASAVYGSDAVGGVVNIITKRGFDGIEARASYGDATRGGLSEENAGITGGLNFTSGSVVFDYSYRNQSRLDAADRDFSSAIPFDTDLFPHQTTNSLYSGGRIGLSNDLHLSFDTYVSQRSTDSVENVDGQDWAIARSRLFGGSAGLDWDFSEHWRAELFLTGGKDQIDSSVGPPNTPENIGQAQSSVELMVDGPFYALPAGDAKVAAGVSTRYQSYDSRFNATPTLDSDSSRTIKTAFSEFSVPLIGSRDSVTGIERLDLSLAARYEDYSDFGSTTNPKVGLIWTVTNDLTMRATYGTSFRAPTLFESRAFYEGDFLVDAPNSASPTGSTLTILRGYGSNPSLKPEKAKTWNAGLDFHPVSLPSLNLSANYFAVHYTNRIDTALTNPFNPFSVESYYPQLFNLSPSAALISRLTSTPWNGASGFLSFVGPFNPSQIGAVVDNRFQNIATADVQGFDFSTSFKHPVGPGSLELALAATYFLTFNQSSGNNAPVDELLDTVGEPPRFKARADTTFKIGDFALHTAVNYTNEYRDVTQTPVARVASWTTVDAGVVYTPAAMKGLEVSILGLNVFDRNPPYVNDLLFSDPLGYDPANASPVGRFITVRIRQRF
jgi:iron complex outermembrane recepter protein